MNAQGSLCSPLLSLGVGRERRQHRIVRCCQSLLCVQAVSSGNTGLPSPFAFPALCTFLVKPQSKTLAIVSVAERRLQLNTFKHTQTHTHTYVYIQDAVHVFSRMDRLLPQSIISRGLIAGLCPWRPSLYFFLKERTFWKSFWLPRTHKKVRKMGKGL